MSAQPPINIEIDECTPFWMRWFHRRRWSFSAKLLNGNTFFGVFVCKETDDHWAIAMNIIRGTETEHRYTSFILTD